MKKIVLIESETAKAVEEFAASLNSAENLVDKVLQAARLQRHEKSPMSTELIKSMMAYGLAALATVCASAALIVFIIFINS